MEPNVKRLGDDRSILTDQETGQPLTVTLMLNHEKGDAHVEASLVVVQDMPEEIRERLEEMAAALGQELPDEMPEIQAAAPLPFAVADMSVNGYKPNGGTITWKLGLN